MRPLDHWAEPGTQHVYPLSYEAYRRTREAEEKPLPRHRALGATVDRQLYERWRLGPAPEVEVLLTMRGGAPARVRRMVAAILLTIRRGRTAGDAIRRVSKRFGLRPGRARAFLAACLAFQVRPIQDHAVPPAPGAGQPRPAPVDCL